MDEFNQNNQNNQQDPFNEQPQRYYSRPETPQQGEVPPQYQQYSPYQQYTPYQPQQYPTGMAVASLVIGIVSIVFSYFTMVFLPLAVVPIIGIVLGGLYKSKHYPVGKGLSTAGIITSVIGLILPIALMIIMIIVVYNMMANGTLDELMRQTLDMLKQYSPEDYEMYYKQFAEQFPQWFGTEAIKFLFK